MSQTLFEIVTHVTRDSCRAQARAHSGRRSRTAWICCAMIAAGVAVLWAVDAKFAVWPTVLLGILLVQMLLQSETLGWRLYSARNREAHEVRLTFADGGIWVRTRVEETRMDYGAVTGLFEDAGYLVVRMKHHTPLVVLKADVPGGQADALRDMLCRKTGQTVRRLRP